ncbi:diguanylate cyclase domain-containing protein [Bosea sp. TAB14]|jgi:diguanylate cyclase (GGDEF)-like protein|uniref:diguanylate cyclase domain-containing protein n=1 Tax=Bosea sp. TAB14 TaxID=3237481 RepID=UPI003F925638
MALNIEQQRIASELCRVSGKPSSIGAWECNLANVSLSWTDGVYDLFGLQRGSTIQRSSILDLYEESSRTEMDRLRSKAIRTGEAFSLDCRIRTASNEKRWMRLIVGVGYQHGRPFRIFGSKQDVTAEKGLWTGLATLKQRDPLVERSARRSFEDLVAQTLLDRRLEQETFALIMLDIDDFHDIVDAFGPAASDELLLRFEERLARLFPDAFASSRIGKSQFALLLRMSAGQQRLAASLENAQHLLSRPIMRGHAVIDFTISIGAVVLNGERHRDPAALFAEAHAALHVAGMTGGNTLQMFDRPLASPPLRLAQ